MVPLTLPGPYQIVHRCPTSGLTLVDTSAGADGATCRPPYGYPDCGAPLLPDQAPRAGHAWVYCPYCKVSVGTCGAAALAAVDLEAARILASA